jgi:hypothetical protein
MDPNVRGCLQTTISGAFWYFCVGLQLLFEALKSMCYTGYFRILGQNLGQILKEAFDMVRRICAAINKDKGEFLHCVGNAIIMDEPAAF